MLSKVLLLSTLQAGTTLAQNLLPTMLQSGIPESDTTLTPLNDPPPPVEQCEDIEFCMRTREYRRDTEKQGDKADLLYQVSSHNFDDDAGRLDMTLDLGCDDSGYLAKSLDASMWFYQDGITRLVLGEPSNTRFAISEHDLPVVWDQLEMVEDLSSLATTYTKDGTEGILIQNLNRTDSCSGDVIETFSYDIQTKPVFQVKQLSNDIVTQVINPAGSLYVEDMFITDIP